MPLTLCFDFFFFLVLGMDPRASDMLSKSPILGCSCSSFIMNVNICVYKLLTSGQGIWAVGSEGRLKETGISASYSLYSGRGSLLCCLLIVCLQDYTLLKMSELILVNFHKKKTIFFLKKKNLPQTLFCCFCCCFFVS